MLKNQRIKGASLSTLTDLFGLEQTAARKHEGAGGVAFMARDCRDVLRELERQTTAEIAGGMQ